MNVLMVFVTASLLAFGVSCGAPLAQEGPAEADESTTPASPSNPAPLETRDLFPTYRAENLNGTMMALPADVPGADTVIVVAFRRQQQRIIDRWLAEMAPLFADFSTLDYVEVPVIKRMNRMSRWFIDRGMRGGIPETERRARVVTLYLDKAEFRARLDIPAAESVHLYLVGPDGAIRWRAEGEASESALAGLRAALEAAEARRRSVSRAGSGG